MMENKHVAQPPTEQPASPPLLPVTRDPNFVRIVPDDIIVMHRERDVQISLIVEGPDPVKQTMPGLEKNGFQVQEIRWTHSFTEIARVGLPSGVAFNMAMNIVEAQVESGAISISALREKFLAMLDEHETPKEPRPKAPAVRRKQ
jgi:hypothetical protein